jgi:hypothetical protein
LCNFDLAFSLFGLSYQMMSISESLVLDVGLACAALADSILDYGQFIILSTGNFLYSAATANSTMDFSTKPIEDNVVDSPPSGRPRPRVSCSPSPLRSIGQPTSPNSSERMAQRKLYGDEGCPNISPVLNTEVQREIYMEPPNIAASLQWFPSPSTGVQPK